MIRVVSCFKSHSSIFYIFFPFLADNFVLDENLLTARLIDWDFLKEENLVQSSGTKGYAAPEVRIY